MGGPGGARILECSNESPLPPNESPMIPGEWVPVTLVERRIIEEGKKEATEPLSKYESIKPGEYCPCGTYGPHSTQHHEDGLNAQGCCD